VLGGMSAAALMLGGGPFSGRGMARPFFRGDPFSLGVASGDPMPDGVVICTRLAPDPLAEDGSGGMPDRSVPVRWEVATDEGFRNKVLGRGRKLGAPELAHSVHVEVEGLDPAREYFYRFEAGGERSPVSRTRTARRQARKSPSSGSRSPRASSTSTATTRPTNTWRKKISTSSSTSGTTSASTEETCTS
jgi:alkaline phosphatase D